MNNKKDYLSDMDEIIDEALRHPTEAKLPQDFTDRMMALMEKKIFWRETVMEFGYKCLIAMSALIIFGLIYFFVSVKEFSLLQSYINHHRDLIAGALAVGLFVLFADQVFLKCLFKKHQTE